MLSVASARGQEKSCAIIASIAKIRGLPLLFSLTLALQAAPAEEVNVYSGRKEALIKPLFDRFTEETGTRVNLVTGNADALIKRLELEGERSPADLLVTVDAGRLHRAKEQGLLQAISSAQLNEVVPEIYRDPQGNPGAGDSVRQGQNRAGDAVLV